MKRFLYTFTGCSLKEIGLIFIGSALLSIGLAWYAEPFGMVTGGITGIAIIISNVSQNVFSLSIPMWFTNIVLNVPLFAVSALQRGFKFVKKSLTGVIFLSLWLFVFENTPILFDVGKDQFLACVLCGVFSGAGLGLVLRTGATTGGTDMLGAAIKYGLKHLSISTLIFVIDAIIIIGGVFVFGPVTTMYAVIAVAICTKGISMILDGMYFAKAVFILSEKTDEISERIQEVFDHSSTGIPAKGMYTKKDMQMLFVVIYPKEIGILRTLIYQIDPQAFVTVCDAKEVLGEGFIEDHELILR